MALVGYIWVGPLEHSAEFQRDLLRKRGTTIIFEDISASVSPSPRAQLTSALDHTKDGDTLVIWRLDRLAGTLAGVLSLLELLGRRGVGVFSIAEELDTARGAEKPLLEVITSLNALERQLVRERTMVGVYAARARGRVAGRPRALSATNIDRVVALREQGATVREIAQQLGTSRATIYRALEAVGGEDEEQEEGASETTLAEGTHGSMARFTPAALGDADGFLLAGS